MAKILRTQIGGNIDASTLTENVQKMGREAFVRKLRSNLREEEITNGVAQAKLLLEASLTQIEQDYQKRREMSTELQKNFEVLGLISALIEQSAPSKAAEALVKVLTGVEIGKDRVRYRIDLLERNPEAAKSYTKNIPENILARSRQWAHRLYPDAYNDLVWAKRRRPELVNQIKEAARRIKNADFESLLDCIEHGNQSTISFIDLVYLETKASEDRRSKPPQPVIARSLVITLSPQKGSMLSKEVTRKKNMKLNALKEILQKEIQDMKGKIRSHLSRTVDRGKIDRIVLRVLTGHAMNTGAPIFDSLGDITRIRRYGNRSRDWKDSFKREITRG